MIQLGLVILCVEYPKVAQAMMAGTPIVTIASILVFKKFTSVNTSSTDEE
jgi:hypothetical protein